MAFVVKVGIYGAMLCVVTVALWTLLLGAPPTVDDMRVIVAAL